MNICGVLVHANPAKVDTVLAALAGLPGVEMHQTGSGGRIVVTVEDGGNTTALDTMAAIHRLDGIVAASLVYHHFEPEMPAISAVAPA
jgi:nitrate reductase NapD